MKIRVAIFGSGQMARIYGDVLKKHDLAQLAGFVGNSSDKVEHLKRDYEVPVYGDGNFKNFLNDVEVDAVIIATPEWVRLEPLKAAIDAGKAILIEKPFADSWEEAKQLYEVLNGYSHVIQFCHVLRFSPRFFAMKKMVSEGDVGDIRHMHGCRNSNNQRVKRVLGKANLAFWLTPHDIDIMRWLSESEVSSVYTLSRGKLDTADDYIVSLLRFENGVTAIHEVSWCTPPLSAAAREAFFQVRGTEGAIELDDFATNIRLFAEGDRVMGADTYENFSIQGQHHGFFRIMVDGFLSRVVSQLNDPKDLEDAFESMRVCEMISRSVKLGREVKRREVQ
jgi:predicted dehydrogenase